MAAPHAFGREAFEFVEGLDRLPSADAVADAMHEAIGGFGFEGLIVSGLRPEPGQTSEDLLLAARCPAEFRTTYAARDYIRFDPNVRCALRLVQPFEWTENSYTDDDRPRVAEIMSFLAEFGFPRGFVVPIHGPFGFVAGIGMAGAKPELAAHHRPGVHLMALYAFERVRHLAVSGTGERPVLTSREREVLAWAAQGKSAWEIGEILKVAKRTVDEHAQTAMRKLGATTRTHAVALAIRHRLFEV